MSPATSWTEQSVTASTWDENIPAPSGYDGYALFGMPIPISGGLVMADSTATWAKASQSATSYTEGSLSSATVWTEAGS